MDANAKFSVEGVAAGVRADGRGLLDYRACVATEDTLLHANGSAMVTLGGLGRGSTTRCLGVVKAEVGRCADHSDGASPRGVIDGTVSLAMFPAAGPTGARGVPLRVAPPRAVLLADFPRAARDPRIRRGVLPILNADVAALEQGGSSSTRPPLRRTLRCGAACSPACALSRPRREGCSSSCCKAERW